MDSYDDDIARAIALSLQDTQGANNNGLHTNNDANNNPMDYEDQLRLALAIEASKTAGESPAAQQVRNNHNDYHASDDNYENQLRTAIEASKASMSRGVSPPNSSHVSSASPPPLSKTTTTTTHSQAPIQPIQTTAATTQFLSERAKLEKERLERQKRLRKAQGLPTSDDEKKKNDNDDDAEEEWDEGEGDDSQPTAKRQRLSSFSARAGHANGRPYSSGAAAGSAKASSSMSSRASGTATGKGTGTGNTTDGLFWNGELRPTATRGSEPRKDKRPTFRLTEILGKQNDVAFAIISTFALDLSWIYSLFDPSVPVILISQPDSSGMSSIKNVLPNWIKTTPYLRGGFGSMHMKFMLIFYKTGRLRVAVTTANLVDFDWRDIENAAWVQDLPPLPAPVPFDKKNTESFQYVMKRVLDGVNVKPALATMRHQDHPNLPITQTEEICTRWDWSKVRVHLVPSIAGKHEGWPNVLMNGHTRLMKALRNMGCRTGTPSTSAPSPSKKTAKGKSKDKNKVKTLSIECLGSSIGQYSTQWLNEFHYSARGESAEDWLNVTKRKREKQPSPSEEEMKILFPSMRRVRESMHGERGGGTIFCKRSQWEAANFPKHLFRESRSRAGNNLMHTKMIIGLLTDKVQSRSVVATASSKGKGKVVAKAEPEVIDLISSSESDNDSVTESETESDSDELEVVNPPMGWVYVGSHNFTPSAWGTLSGSAFNPVMNIRNYELGIVFPVRSQADIESLALFERPPAKYRAGDTPWFQGESEYFRVT